MPSLLSRARNPEPDAPAVVHAQTVPPWCVVVDTEENGLRWLKTARGAVREDALDVLEWPWWTDRLVHDKGSDS